MNLLTAKAAPTSSQPNVQPQYWPLGPQPALVNRPIPNEQHGGLGSTDYRTSVAVAGYDDDPVYDETATVHIWPTFPGEDGYEMVSTVHPYDKVVGVYTQPGQRMVPSWQNLYYGPDHREQLRAPAIGSANISPTPALTRPAVLETDYSLQSLTSDASQVYGVGDSGYTGIDWNAYGS